MLSNLEYKKYSIKLKSIIAITKHAYESKHAQAGSKHGNVDDKLDKGKKKRKEIENMCLSSSSVN